MTAYTPGYTDLRIRWESSICMLGREVEFMAIPYASTGDWVKNGHIKPRALLQARAAHPDRPLAWVDADAIVRQVPALFDACDALDLDVAYHTVHKTGEALSGTLWVGAQARRREGQSGAFLRRWLELTEEHPNVWDQGLMDSAAKDVGAVRGWLPAEYCWVDYFAEPRWGGPRDPVIEHTQASRDVRAGKRAM